MLTKIDCYDWSSAIQPTRLNEFLSPSCPISVLDLRNDHSNFWTIPLDDNPLGFENCLSLLTDPEKERATRFRHEGAKTQFVIGHGIIHLLLKQYLDTDYEGISFEESEHHKPFIRLQDGTRPLEYNLSHCEDYLAIAIGSKSQGIDIEKHRYLKDLAGISRQVFTEKEIEIVFSSTDQDHQVEAFFKFWTCKEAVLKANGTGFMKDPKSLEIELNPSDTPAHHKVYWSGGISGHSLAWTEDLSF